MTHLRGFSWVSRTISKEKAIGFLFPLMLAVVFALYNQNQYRDLYGDLDDFGRQTMATIIDKRVARYNPERPLYKHQMMVSFTVGGKMMRGHVQVTSDFYEKHEVTERVPIRYLPENPQIREIDSAMRDRFKKQNLTVILVFVFIAFANFFFVGERRQKNQADEIKHK